MKITLCMITGDNDQYLDAINSSLSFVDSVVVVYTGEQEFSSQKLVHCLTQKHPSITCSPGSILGFKFPWTNDFSAARNRSFNLAFEFGADWIFWMDSDDILEKGKELRQLFEGIINNSGINCILMPYEYAYDEKGNCSLLLWRERLFHKGFNPVWKYPVHECINLDNAVIGKIYHPIKHMRKVGEGGKSSARNMAIFEVNKDKEEYQLDSRFWFYYGNCLKENGCLIKAIDAYNVALSLGLWEDDEYQARLHIAESWYELHEYDKSRDVLYSIYEEVRFNKFSSHIFLLGVISYYDGFYNISSGYLSEAIKPVPESLFPVYTDHYDKEPKLWLKRAKAAIGEHNPMTVVFEGTLGSEMPQDRLRRENIAIWFQKEVWSEVTVSVEIGELKGDAYVLTRYIDVSKERMDEIENFVIQGGVLFVDICEDIFDLVRNESWDNARHVLLMANDVIASSTRLAERVDEVFGIKPLVIEDMYEEGE